MNFQRPYRGDDDDAVRLESRVAAFHITEFLKTAIGAEAGLRHQIAVVTEQTQTDLVGDNGAVSMRDIGEGARMHECWAAFESLHEIGHQGVLEQNGHCPRSPQFICCDWLTGTVQSDHDSSQSLPQIFEVGGQSENRHYLRGRRDIETAVAGHSVFAVADDDVAQRTIVHVNHPAPGNVIRIEIETLQSLPLQPFVAGPFFVIQSGIDSGGQEIVCGADGVKITGQMQVQIVHRHDLRIPTTGPTSLDPEGRTERRLTDCSDRALADHTQRLAQPNRGECLAFAQLSGGDSGDDDVLRPVGPWTSRRGGIEMDLGLRLPVQIDIRRRQPHVAGDLCNRSELCSS